MASILIRGGRLLSPADKLDEKLDLRIENGVITEIGPKLTSKLKGSADTILDARGQVVAPGFVDIHIHLREPGGEASETIETGLRAAVAGGFTAVCPMPNTRPVNDSPILTRTLVERGAKLGLARVLPIAAVSPNSDGERLTEFAALVEAGAVGFSDDGRPVATAGLLRRALDYSERLGVPVIDHCEDPSLSAGGVMNEGAIAARMGLRGITRAAEDVIAARDIIVSEQTGGRLHLAHLSTAGSVELVRLAKSRQSGPGRITCEVTPHHYILTEAALGQYDTKAKMNPPLRTEQDIQAIQTALADGTIDAIATDHAPHSDDSKQVEFDRAPFGITGLETAVALALTYLVHPGKITLPRMVELLSSNPARIIRQPLGRITQGGTADLTLFDPEREWTYHAATGESKSHNSPFNGWKLRGAVTATLVAGNVVYQRL